MTDINYPDTLRSPLRGTLVEGFIDNKIEDDRDAGVFNARVVTTKLNLTFQYSIKANEEQKQTLLNFYDVTTQGVKIFNWIHPISGDIYEVTFDSRPSVTTNFPNHHDISIAITTV